MLNAHSHLSKKKLIAAFIAGQIVMLGFAYLLRSAPAEARGGGDGDTATALTTQAVFVRKGANGAGIQLSAEGAAGGPSITLFDSTGASRLQMSLDGQGRPTVLLRRKAGDVAIGLGTQGDDQATIAVRGAGGKLVTLEIPEK